MKKKILYILASLLALSACKSAAVYAGLITHNDYTGGSVITSASQNTNENAIVNEFNGNIDNTNIKTGGITSTNILDGTILLQDLNSTLTSTFTYVNNVRNYKRPSLNFVDTSNVDISTNTTTANQTCIAFADDFRCVTENAEVTTKYRRWNTSASCSFLSGTEDSGPYPTSIATNSWDYLYAVKSQIDTTKFVICSSTDTPRQEDSAALNGMFGVNGWVPLGLIRYGDNAGSTGSVLSFSQSGSYTLLTNNVVPTTADDGTGIKLAEGTGTSVAYTWLPGTGTIQVPAILKNGIYAVSTGGGSGSCIVQNKAASWDYYIGSGSIKCAARFSADIGSGITVTNGSSVAMDIFLSGFWDASLDSFTSPF